MFFRKTQQGFTLIELLVVIGIIGALASIVIVSVREIRAKARDTRRMSDMRQIQTALRFFYDSRGRYPDVGTENAIIFPACTLGNYDYSRFDTDSNGKFFIDELDDAEFISPVPRDPRNSAGGSACMYSYIYKNYSAGSGCPAGLGEFYTLSIGTLESSGSTPAEKSAAWNSPGCAVCPALTQVGEWWTCGFTNY